MVFMSIASFLELDMHNEIIYTVSTSYTQNRDGEHDGIEEVGNVWSS